jgi:hypothetical protein
MKVYYFLLFILMVSVGCSSYKTSLVRTGTHDIAIQNAILDFSNTGKLYKRDSVFSVSVYDTLHRMVSALSADGSNRWADKGAYGGIIALGIRPDHYRFLLTAETIVGSKGKLTSRFIEKNGKLFYWWDDRYPLTEETLAVLKKYHLLVDDQGGSIRFLENSINDAQKAAHYYFCRNDLSRYKKVITNTGIGYYDPPEVDCNNN